MQNKSAFLLLLLTLVLSGTESYAQTIDTVSTFTFSSTTRSGVFQFPDNPNKTYEKIKMLYRMRCKNGLISTSSNRNLGCGEWDYSCNTYLTDSSRIDSLKATYPEYIISGFSGSSFPYSLSPTYSITRYRHLQATQVTANEASYSLNTGTDAVQAPFNGQAGNRKIHYLWKASELQAAGLNAGPISGMSLELLQSGLEIRHLRIRMKSTTDSSITAFSDAGTFTEVFFRNQPWPDSGLKKLPFHTFFDWNGSSNILVEISCSNGNSAPGIILKGGSTSFNSVAGTEKNDFYLETDGSSGGISCGDIQSLDSAQTFTFEGWVNIRNWQNWTGIFKDNSKTVLELGDVPGNLYCIIRNPSNTYGYATNVLPLNTWTHVAMVFDGTAATNAARLKLYINGVQKTLTFSGTIPAYTENNNTPLLVGKGVVGRFDDIRIWDKAISGNTISSWYKRSISSAHPDFTALRAAYDLNEGLGNILQDRSASQNPGLVEGNTSWRLFPGFSIFKNAVPVQQRPNIRFYTGAVNELLAEEFIRDSLADLPRIVTQYAIVNGQPAPVDTTIKFLSAGNPLKDEAGNLLEILPSDTSGVINIGTLNYFSRSPQKVELMSFVTPYGINLNFGMAGKVWEFDVSDFVHQLKGRKRISLERGGEYQEELDIKFVFYEGIPARKVLSLTQIWPVTQSANSQIMAQNVFEPRNLLIDPNAASFKIRSAVTGHGQEGEFIPRNHWLNINGGATPEFTWQVWKACGLNPVYPQGGTWVYDRAGWCPGAPTDVQEFNPAAYVTLGQTASFDYGMVSATGDSRYIVNHQLVQYGQANRVHDVAISQIQNPGDNIEFARRNPSCMNPKINITNEGSETLTAVSIYFGLEGGAEQVYNWTGSLPFMKSTEITLPMPNLGSVAGVFRVRSANPNGFNDEYFRNDTMEVKYAAPLLIPGTGRIIIEFKTNLNPSENTWELRNSSGEILGMGVDLLSNTTYRDTFDLDQGCYEFQLLDEAQDGLTWWASTAQGSGSLRFRNGSNGIIKTFNPDFGGEVFQQFSVQAATEVAPSVYSSSDFLLYPNPANNVLYYDLGIEVAGAGKLEVLDMQGKCLLVSGLGFDGSGSIDVSMLPIGFYQMVVHINGSIVRQRFSKM
jgi:hypothetical protein